MQTPQENTPARNGEGCSRDIVLRASADCEDVEAAFRVFADAFGDTDLAFVKLFLSASVDRDAVEDALTRHFTDCTVIGCTTAGEIGPDGYGENSIVALGFPADSFAITAHRISGISRYDLSEGSHVASALMMPDGLGERATWPHCFAILLADGLSRREDTIVASLAPLLGDTPLIGGSAGDGVDFNETFLLHEGRFHRDSAIVALIRTRCPFTVHRFESFALTERRMVVTGADTAERRVTEINAEPAAREYARMIGKDPEQLSPFTFAEDPVVVRVGGDHYCRAIQKVEQNGDLRFYCAIEEGMVLTVAESRDIVENLDTALTQLEATRHPDIVIGFDCVLRRLEAERSQQVHALSGVLRRHRVCGFNTYGEQFSGMHVNQTFTCVALYPASPENPASDHAEP